MKIWDSKEIEDEEKNPQRKKKNSPHGNTMKDSTEGERTGWTKNKEERSPQKKKGLGEHRKSSFKYSISTWIFFHIRLPSHTTQVLETRISPLNSNFIVRDFSLLHSFTNLTTN